MKLIGVRSSLQVKAIAAGTNVVDITVPARHTYRIIDFCVYNPEIATHEIQVYIFDATATYRKSTITDIAITQYSYAGTRQNAAASHINPGVCGYAKAGDIVRINWLTMAGTSAATYCITFEVYRDESHDNDAIPT